MRAESSSRQVRAAAEKRKPKVFDLHLPERGAEHAIHALAAEDGEHGKREIGEEVSRRTHRAHQLFHPRKHVRRGRVSRVQRRHERALRRAPDAIDRNPDVFERAQRAEMCETVSAPAGQDDPDRSTGDVSREPLGVLPAPEPKRMVSHRLGATVSPPSRTLGRFAGCVDENELRGGTASTAPQEASFGRVRRRVPRRRSRDDENFIRLRHAHLRPRRRARVRLQDDEPVVFLLLRHPPREFRPVKFRPQTRDGAVAKLVPRGRFVEPQRRAEHFERASKVPRERRHRGLVLDARGNQRDGHEIRSCGRTLERGVQLPRHRLEESRRRRRVTRAHQRQRAARHSHELAVPQAHRRGRVPTPREQRCLADGLASTALFVRTRAVPPLRSVPAAIVVPIPPQQPDASRDEHEHAGGLLALHIRRLARAEPHAV